MSDGLSGVNSMVSDLNKSIEAAVKRVQDQKAADAAAANPVQEFRKDVRKSPNNTAFFATDIGILARGTTRLNVIGALGANDPADFYKFKVTSKGEAGLGVIGDEGVRVQVQTKLGIVVADSDKSAGKSYDNYLAMRDGTLDMDRGDYTLRVSRDKDVPAKDAKNYAIQLNMGGYTQDFDTVAKNPLKGQTEFQISAAQQAMLDGLTNASANLSSIPSGQSGTQKLLGSFSLFV